MPKEIASLAGALLRNPVSVSVAPVATTADRVDQCVMFVPQSEKRTVLARVLRQQGMGRTLVFARTKHGADRIVQHLTATGMNANAIHGNKSQGQRERALSAFKTGQVPVLVATDIAARGDRCGWRDACHQLRPAGRAGGLRAPHRAHGACGCGGQCDQPVR